MTSHAVEVAEESSSPAPLPVTTHRGAAWAAAIALAIGIGVLALYNFTRANDFPPHYHWDEPSKAEQLLSESGYRNFNHPQLLLETAQFYVDAFKVERSERPAVIAGRWASASWGAVGVACAAFAGYLLYGFRGLLLFGMAMAFCTQLQLNAHFLKEDAAFVGGVLVTVMAAVMVLRSSTPARRWLSVMALGVGCGLACSGKYIGIATVLPALLTVAVAPWRRRWMIPLAGLVVIVAGCVTVALVNHRAFENPWLLRLNPAAASGLARETEHGLTHHYGLSFNTPHSYFVEMAWRTTPLPLQLLGAAALIALLVRRRFSRVGVVLAVFFLMFTVMLSFSPIPGGRYGLPIVVLYHLACIAAVAGAIGLLPRGQWRGVALAAVVVGLGGWMARESVQLNQRFANDSRQQVREWIATNLPAGSRVLADDAAGLHTPGDPWRFPNQPPLRISLRTANYMRGVAPLPVTRQRYDYIVLTNITHNWMLDPAVVVEDGRRPVIEAARAFHRDVQQSCKLVWQSSPHPPDYSPIDRELYVYRTN